MRCFRSCPSRTGFTLVELLVVVSIIALLMSILLPSLSKARAMGRRIACSSNLKQFGLAHQMYADEYNGYYVPIALASSASWGWVWSHNPDYRELIGLPPRDEKPYGPSELVCPSSPAEEIEPGHFPHVYAMNRAALLGRDYPWSIHRPSLPAWSAQKIQMVDHTSWNATAASASPDRWHTNGDISGHRGGVVPGGTVAYRHEDGANALHFDGHVSHYTIPELGEWSGGLDPDRVRKWFINENYPGTWQ